MSISPINNVSFKGTMVLKDKNGAYSEIKTENIREIIKKDDSTIIEYKTLVPDNYSRTMSADYKTRTFACPIDTVLNIYKAIKDTPDITVTY